MCWIDSVTTGHRSYLQGLFAKERVWELRPGWGRFSGSCPHTTAPLSAQVSLRGGVSVALSQITLSVCVNMGRSLLTWQAAEWQGPVLKAGTLVRCSTIPQKPHGTNLLNCERINRMFGCRFLGRW